MGLVDEHFLCICFTLRNCVTIFLLGEFASPSVTQSMRAAPYSGGTTKATCWVVIEGEADLIADVQKKSIVIYIWAARPNLIYLGGKPSPFKVGQTLV